MYKLREQVEKWEKQCMTLQDSLDEAERGWRKQEGKVLKIKRELKNERRRNSVLNGDMLQMKQVKPQKNKSKGFSLMDEMEPNPKDKPVSNLALEMNFDEEEMFMPSAQTTVNRATINFTPKGTIQSKGFAFPIPVAGLSMSEVFHLEVLPKNVPVPEPEAVVEKQSEPDPPKQEEEVSPVTKRKRRTRVLSQRKPAIEEYFVLAAQSVKLNSPYMDTICTIPTDLLYAKAMADAVPFHRWHIWVENYLNKEYIRSMYSSTIRGSERSRPKK